MTDNKVASLVADVYVAVQTTVRLANDLKIYWRRLRCRF